MPRKNKISQQVVIFLLTIILITNTNTNCHGLNNTIEVLTVNHSINGLEVGLDYDFSTTYEESMAFIATFSPNEYLKDIEGLIIFIRTPLEENYFFWMLGNPFLTAQNWQQGFSSQHFSISDNSLFVYFTEYESFTTPNLYIYTYATFSSIIVDSYSNDFSDLLLHIPPLIPIEDQTTSSESEQPTTSESTTTITTESSIITTVPTQTSSSSEPEQNTTITTSESTTTITTESSSNSSINTITRSTTQNTTSKLQTIPTPGFEYLMFLVSLVIVPIIRKQKRKNS